MSFLCKVFPGTRKGHSALQQLSDVGFVWFLTFPSCFFFFPCELLECSSFTTPLSSYVLPILLCIVVEQEGTAIWGLPEIRVTVRIISHIWIVTVCSELCSVVVFMCSFPKSKFRIMVSSNVPQRQYTGSCLGVISLGPVMSFYPFSLLFPNVCSSHCRTSWRL